MKLRPCETCGAKFMPGSSTQVKCPPCQAIAKRDRAREYWRANHKIKVARLCPWCMRWRVPANTKLLSSCGSKECRDAVGSNAGVRSAMIVRNKQASRRHKSRQCLKCGVEFRSPLGCDKRPVYHFCNECRGLIQEERAAEWYGATI